MHTVSHHDVRAIEPSTPYRRAMILELLNPDAHPILTVTPPDLTGCLQYEAGLAALNALYIEGLRGIFDETDPRQPLIDKIIRGERQIALQIGEMYAYRMRVARRFAAELHDVEEAA